MGSLSESGVGGWPVDPDASWELGWLEFGAHEAFGVCEVGATKGDRALRAHRVRTTEEDAFGWVRARHQAELASAEEFFARMRKRRGGHIHFARRQIELFTAQQPRGRVRLAAREESASF